MKIAIVVQSNTGNTRQLAEAIQSALPDEMLIYSGAPAPEALQADLIFVGSWTDKGVFAKPVLDFLAQCHQKQLALFATCGFGQSDEYFQAILKRSADQVPADNMILGCYACQGRMPETVKQRYLALQAKEPENPRWASLLENFDAALSHPDSTDLEGGRHFAQRILTKLQ